MLLLGGISGAGMMTFLEAYRPLLMVATFTLLGAAFYVTYRPRRGSEAVSDTQSAMQGTPAGRVQSLNKILLWAVTLVTVALFLVPQSALLRWTVGDEFTADMQRTVFRVEGMT